jgi:hypothetical protein
MDKRKQQVLAKKQEKEQKAKENNPAFKYINYSKLDFPSLIRQDAMNDFSAVDDKLEKLWVEVSLLEEQIELRTKLEMDIASGKTNMMASDGRRLMSMSELKTQRRIADLTAYQSKSNIEKILTDMIQMVGIEIGENEYILTEEEHNAIAMSVVDRVAKSGIRLFQSNRQMLIKKLKGN